MAHARRRSPLFDTTVEFTRRIEISGDELHLRVEPLPHGLARVMEVQRRKKGSQTWRRDKAHDGDVATLAQLGAPADLIERVQKGAESVQKGEEA